MSPFPSGTKPHRPDDVADDSLGKITSSQSRSVWSASHICTQDKHTEYKIDIKQGQAL